MTQSNLMGIGFNKQQNCHSQICENESYLQTAKGFSDELHRQINAEDMNEFSNIFHRMSVSADRVKKCLYNYMNNKKFKSMFEVSVCKFNDLSNKPSELDYNMLKTCLTNHCFSVLTSYIDIIDNINSSDKLNEILSEMATSHCFIEDFNLTFKFHNELFGKFVKKEFGKKMNKESLQAMETYLNLICTRIIILTEQQDNNTPRRIVSAMEDRRKSIKNKVSQLDEFIEIYINPNIKYLPSDDSLVSSIMNCPGTSTTFTK